MLCTSIFILSVIFFGPVGGNSVSFSAFQSVINDVGYFSFLKKKRRQLQPKEVTDSYPRRELEPVTAEGSYGFLSPMGIRASKPRYARQESLRARYDRRELRALIPEGDKKIAANHIFKFSEQPLLLDLVFINHDPVDNLIAYPEYQYCGGLNIIHAN